MASKKLKAEIKKQYQMLSDGMNRKFAFIIGLKKFYLKYGYVPEDYQERWDMFMIQESGLLWYDQHTVVRKLQKTARILAKRELKK